MFEDSYSFANEPQCPLARCYLQLCSSIPCSYFKFHSIAATTQAAVLGHRFIFAYFFSLLKH